MKEAYPLAWPEGRRRTLIRDRKDKKAWKLTTLQYKKALEDEFRRMGVRFHVVTSNVQSGWSTIDAATQRLSSLGWIEKISGKWQLKN